MTITSPRRSTASVSSRSIGRKNGFGWPFAAIASASSTSLFSRRATSRSVWPCAAKTWASAVPIPADPPVISVTGCMSGLAGAALGGHAPAQLDPVAPGDAKQIRGAPDQIVLELADAAVGVDHLPHHLDHAPPSILVERPVDQAGEVVEVDRLVLGLGRLGDQLVGGRVVETEPPLDDGMQLVTLDVRDIAVDRGGVHQQGRRGETIIVGLEAGRMLAALRDVGQEISEGFEHRKVAAGAFAASRRTSPARSPARSAAH